MSFEAYSHSLAEVLDQPELEDELSRRLTREESWLMCGSLLTLAIAVSTMCLL